MHNKFWWVAIFDVPMSESEITGQYLGSWDRNSIGLSYVVHRYGIRDFVSITSYFVNMGVNK